MSERESVFVDIYKNDKWGGGMCKSGGGSLLSSTVVLRRELPAIINQLKIKSLIDAPCGVGSWMHEIAPTLSRYLGVDIVKEAVEQQSKLHAENMSFEHGDIIDFKFPKYDAILCRDCLVHLDNKSGIAAITNFLRAEPEYLLLTNYSIKADKNRDIRTGNWHEMDLTKSPFNLPKPFFEIDERESKGKKLAIFRAAEIQITNFELPG
jgi:SAM-dependent methyltransferase